MYVVAQSVMFPSATDSPQKKPNIIQATLVFDLPTPTPEIPVETIKEETPLPVEPEKDIPIAETPTKSQSEPISESETPTIAALPQVELKKKVHKKIPKELQEKIQEKPEQSDDVNKITPTDKNITPTASLDMLTPTTNMVRRHLNSFQKQQQNRLAEQASQYYQQRKNSPVINAEVKEPFMSEDEKFRDNLKIRVNCSSNTKKTTAILLGLLGGNIGCSKPPAFEGFIQNRINKVSHLPGKHQQKEQKIPQSVVIKKQP
jgi:hypothetical protein